MINSIFVNFFRFILLVLLQVVVLNNIQLGGFINPYLYVLFIILLPFETPNALLLLLSFLLGLSVDMFANTMGIHASACVFMAFCRPYILKLIAPRDGYEAESQPTIKNQGLRWFVVYITFLVFLHHTFLFYVEVFRFSEFFMTLLRVVLSSALTIILVLMSQYLFYKAKADK
jgi:rod shape-determining protein MreD